MLRWGKKSEKQPKPETPEAGAAGDEWAFLRSQGDHDADEMASVREMEPPPDAPPPAAPLQQPVAEPEPASALGGDASGDSEEAPVQEPSAHPGEPAQPRMALQIELAGRSQVVTIEETSLIGRRDDEIGLAPHIDLSADPEILRCHALIRLREGDFYLIDLGTGGGTHLNGRPLAREAENLLAPGDTVTLGRLVTMSVLAGEVDPELSDEDLLIGHLAGAVWDPAAAGVDAAAEDGDILDIALQRGRAAGLLSPRRPDKQ